MLFNLHTHTSFSDGSDEPLKYVEEAIRQGFHTLGFSDHSPVPFKNTFAIPEERLAEYYNTIKELSAPPRLQARGLEGQLNILLALEVDYIPGLTKPVDDYREHYSFDYFIGSVHLVRNDSAENLWFIDGPDIGIYDSGLQDVFHGDIRKAVTAYYHQVNGMILTQKPDIIGHLDKIKMYNRNRYFREDETWYAALVDETLELIREAGCIVEVNTRGVYKKRSETLFPGPEILKKIHQLNIPITLSSDAHKPHELSLGFDSATVLLKEIGFRSLWLKTADGWIEGTL